MARRPSYRRLDPDRASLLFVFLLLPFALYAVMVLWPFVQAVSYSLTSWSGFSPDKPFVGLDNYTELWGDETFRTAVRNNLVLLVALPAVTLGIAFAFAVLVTVGGPTAGGVRGVSGSAFYRVISFFPYVIPAIVIGLIWAQVYDPNNGLLNGVLTGCGLDGFEAFAWLGEKSTAMAASILVAVWGMVGFYMVLFIAAIQGIDREVLEAARLDGAGRARVARSIVAPYLAGNVRAAYLYMGIFALDAFVYMQALNSTGGPDNSTLVITQQIYTTAFAKGDFGKACAMGVVLAGLTFCFVGVVRLVSLVRSGPVGGKA
ncbi:sugar ABC transporter permease [Kineosporia sp. J2-2]|uniref:Sugar ABC transporter permease n=1 Tax=Kineosporia corallincola TaxID=2835133 RepID=A0ABS5TC24_9ACTN|nr:sugar ABC transporter permease [Kineosporia corallincola]MBT0768632.1 sugar ABC transporter permease [Kineosporia corallincola]